MYATTTSILPPAPKKGNDPAIKFTNALIKKVSKDKIKQESARHGKQVRRSIIRLLTPSVPTNRRYKQTKNSIRNEKN